jgi:copper chaperone CopZ
MKRFLMTSLATLFTTVCLHAGELATLVVTTTPQMHCQKCENKIKSNIRFVKGVKDIQTSVEKQQVSISYDANKSTVADFEKAFQKIGYTISVIENTADKKKETKK